MTLLKTTGLTKKFGNLKALDSVDIEVAHGEVFGFIGPNGSGKSTMLRILLGLLKATEGKAEIFGLDSWKNAVEIHKRIAYIPGEVSLWPNLTGGEVIDLFIKLRGGQPDGKREELIRRFDLDPRKKCRTYSKGNRQKVALVAALCMDAELYILDEPTAGLDPLMERSFQEYVMELKAKGKSVLLSSHILSEVEKICDKVAIIRQGKIIETGTLNELRHLTGTMIQVETKRPVIGLSQLEGVSGVKGESGLITFQAELENLDAIMRHISGFGILRMESSPPTLEDLFIRHYERAGQTGGEG